MDWAELRHWPGNLSVITPRRGGTEHGFFREGGLWPRSPRNFATEPASFYDATKIFNELTGETTIKIKFKLVSIYTGFSFISVANLAIWFGQGYGISTQARKVDSKGTLSWVYSALNSRYFAMDAEDIAEITATFGSDYVTGECYVNDVLVQSRTSYLSSGESWYASTAGISTTAPVNILASSIYNNGQTIWSYPSESERLRLITTNGNVIAGDRYFEAANPADKARIDSQIDLRGKVSDYTVVVDFEAATLTANGDKQELAGQGAAYTTIPAICATARVRSNNRNFFVVSHEVGGVRAAKAIPSPDLTGRHRIATTIRINETSTTMAIFLNGALLSSQTVTGKPTGIAGSVNTCFSINDNRVNYGTNFFGKIYAAALFNRALSDSQINLLSRG